MAQQTHLGISGENEKAIQRILAYPAGAAGWLLNYIDNDLGHLSDGQWSDLLAEAAIFASGGVIYEGASKKLAPDVNMGLWECPMIDLVGKARSERKLSPNRGALKDLHNRLNGALRDFFGERSHAEMTLPKITIRLLNPVRYVAHKIGASESEGAFFEVTAETRNDAFYYHAVMLLASCAGKLKRCEACGRPFVAVRSDQVFCSAPCLSRINQQRYRERLKRNKH